MSAAVLPFSLGAVAGRPEAQLRIFGRLSLLTFGDRLGIGVGVVVDAGKRLVDFRVTPPTQCNRELMAWRVRVIVVAIREVVLLDQRSTIVVGESEFLEATPPALVVGGRPPVVRTGRPVVVRADVAGVAVGQA